MSPAEFVKEASGRTDAAWNRDIECEGKPLGVLIDVRTNGASAAENMSNSL